MKTHVMHVQNLCLIKMVKDCVEFLNLMNFAIEHFQTHLLDILRMKILLFI